MTSYRWQRCHDRVVSVPVFVTTADPNVFELRRVRVGKESDGRYQVLEGLTVGDRVVTSGSFMLRAEWLKVNQGSEHTH